MARAQWKVAEQRLCDIFGTTRRPLSGGNDKRGRDDSLHPRLFLENKYSKCLPIRRLWEETRDKAKEEAKGRTPVVGLQEKGKPGVLLVINSQDLEKVLREYARAQGLVLADPAIIEALKSNVQARPVRSRIIAGPIVVTSPRKRPPTPKRK